MIIKLYKWVENIWFKIHEKIRYLLVGGFNTVVAYGLFIALFLALSRYNLALALQFVISINLSFFTMRYYVFRGRGKLWKEYVKGISVYLWIFVFNWVGLNFLVKVCKLEPIWAQGIYLTVSMILTYILHKNFSFKERKK